MSRVDSLKPTPAPSTPTTTNTTDTSSGSSVRPLEQQVTLIPVDPNTNANLSGPSLTHNPAGSEVTPQRYSAGNNPDGGYSLTPLNSRGDASLDDDQQTMSKLLWDAQEAAQSLWRRDGSQEPQTRQEQPGITWTDARSFSAPLAQGTQAGGLGAPSQAQGSANGLGQAPTHGTNDAAQAITSEADTSLAQTSSFEGLLGPLAGNHAAAPRAADAALVGERLALLTRNAEQGQQHLPHELASMAQMHEAAQGTLMSAMPAALPHGEVAQALQAQLGHEQAARMLQQMMQGSQPLMAAIWGEMFALQQARIDRLANLYRVNDKGEAAPADEDEAAMQRRRIGEIDLGAMSPGQHAPSDEDEAKTAAADVIYQAALCAIAMQQPQVMLRMFRGHKNVEARLFRYSGGGLQSRFAPEWQHLTLAPGPGPRMPRLFAAVAQLLQRDGHTGREAGVHALQSLLGQTAECLSPTTEGESRFIKILRRSDAPSCAPMVLYTAVMAQGDLKAAHAYAALGTAVRDNRRMLVLGDPDSMGRVGAAAGLQLHAYDDVLASTVALIAPHKRR